MTWNELIMVAIVLCYIFFKLGQLCEWKKHIDEEYGKPKRKKKRGETDA